MTNDSVAMQRLCDIAHLTRKALKVGVETITSLLTIPSRAIFYDPSTSVEFTMNASKTEGCAVSPGHTIRYGFFEEKSYSFPC